LRRVITEIPSISAALIVSAIYYLKNVLIAVNGGETSPMPTIEECKLKFEINFDQQESKENYKSKFEDFNHLNSELQYQLDKLING
jgi:hypothetical protein